MIVVHTQRRSKEVKGGQRRSKEVKGGQRRSKEVKGGQRRSKEVKGGSTQKDAKQFCVMLFLPRMMATANAFGAIMIFTEENE
jgi:hypothetical protein